MRQLKKAIACFLGVVTAGVVGFKLIEQLSWTDAVYLTVATIATVGYGDIVPVTASGKVFTASLIVLGVGSAGYTMTLLFSLIVEGHMKDYLGRRTMLRNIACLDHHVIVCGAGRVGSQVIAGLQKGDKPFVVIESDPVLAEAMLEDKIMVICGDAKLDKVLAEAGVKRASFLVAALSNDADNMYVTLSAKNQNSDIVIVSRADDQEAEIKMKQAGSSKIILPSISGGRQMLAAIMHPIAYDFFQNMFYNQDIFVDMAEIGICGDSVLIGKTPRSMLDKHSLNLFIATIKRGDESLSAILDKDTLKCSDILVVLGERTSIQKLSELAGGAAHITDLNLGYERSKKSFLCL